MELQKSVGESIVFLLAKRQDAVLSDAETRCRISATVKIQAEPLLIATEA